MPCEACSVQFTVFRRKKSCTECRRLYCGQCLVKRRDRILCERCVVFTTRPLSKVELLKLKPKDLIFFLQSKHISTTGCVEKEELVNLVLIHVNNSADASPNEDGGAGFGNPFDQIKNTCQNLFTSFTDKIASDLNFDTKSSAGSSPARTPTSPSSQQNIFTQPRSSRRPSASFTSTSTTSSAAPAAGGSAAAAAHPSQQSRATAGGGAGSVSTQPSPTSRSPATSPASPSGRSVNAERLVTDRIELAAEATEQQQMNASKGQQRPEPPKRKRLADLVAPRRPACECSDDEETQGHGGGDDDDDNANGVDDELILQFRRSQSQHSGADWRAAELQPALAGPSGQQPQPAVEAAGAQVESTSAIPTTPLVSDKSPSRPTVDSDDASSFEELATGAATAGTVAASAIADAETWQIIDHCSNESHTQPQDQQPQQPQRQPSQSTATPSETDALVTEQPAAVQPPAEPQTRGRLPPLPSARRVNRRRSESALLAGQSPRRHFSIEAESDDEDAVDVIGENEVQPPGAASAVPEHRHPEHSTTTGSCQRCGKRRANIRRHVARFRRQLESRQVSESEIRRELSEFLAYLERNAAHMSQDGGDDGAPSAVLDDDEEEDDDLLQPPEAMRLSLSGQTDDDGTATAGASGGGGGGLNDADDDDFSFGEDDGIHVYGTDDPMNGGRPARQFINLTDIQISSDLDDLTVKQLKEILMLNRVDFKGCCEKTELLERVKRLWNECSTCPAVDKLPTDDLCKICMDAPIECVILECGHMATCTSCGKVLSECPICRQYIVRVVRFFRA